MPAVGGLNPTRNERIKPKASHSSSPELETSLKTHSIMYKCALKLSERENGGVVPTLPRVWMRSMVGRASAVHEDLE